MQKSSTVCGWHTRFKSTKLPFTRICKPLIRPTSYVKFVLIRIASNLCSFQLRPYSCLIGYPGIETSEGSTASIIYIYKNEHLKYVS